MRVLEINSVCGIKSTGRIATEIASSLIASGNEVIIAYGREQVPEEYKEISYRMTTNNQARLNVLSARLFDNDGFCAEGSTKHFLDWANEYNPDLLWLHNLHGYYINVELLFKWIKTRPKMQVCWTLHDCWAFTGHCSYYTFVKCSKWKSHCEKCIQKREYPRSLFLDNSYRNFEKKKECFCGVKNMKLITPSKWLADEVSQSFLKEYPIEVVKNKIDDTVFKPTPSDIKKKLGLAGKKVVLGVAAQWQVRKGWSDFLKLSDLIEEPYVIVLVGVTKMQKKELPNNIIGIERTSDIKELAELYTAADVFVNPTYEDNYPTTNLEAQACGTPCITYNTGGSVESVPLENVVMCGDIDGLLRRIYELTN